MTQQPERDTPDAVVPRPAGVGGAAKDRATIAGGRPGAGAPLEPSTDSRRRSPLSPEVAQARRELAESRRAFAADLDGLTRSTRASLDIPAKVRRDPLKSAALAGGAGFLLLGGPRRVLRTAGRLIPVRRRDPDAGLLPDAIEKVLRDSGVAKDPAVRQALDRDFADYLRTKGRLEAQHSARTSLWRTYDAVAGPLGTVAARMLVERLFSATQDGRPGPGR